MIALTLYSRPGCHLCEDMKAVIERVIRRDGSERLPAITIDEVDISGDVELEARYGLEIPVLLVNGKKAAKYRLTEQELRRRLLDERRTE